MKFMLGLSETIDGKQCLMVWLCVEEIGWSCLVESIGFGGWRSMEKREAEEDMEKAG